MTCVLGGNSDNTGTGIARRLGRHYYVMESKSYGNGIDQLRNSFFFFVVLKTGLNIMLASNIPKNSPLLEVCSLSLSCAHALESWLQLSRSNGHVRCS